MTSPNTRSALAALDAVRPLIVRLDERRHPEDGAADLIEGWAGVETALRAMMGGSSLGGQALVSDVRAAGLLDYPHAHALLGFLAARDRATRPDYHPSGEDVTAARAGFQAIEAANGVGIAADTATHPTPTQAPPVLRSRESAHDGAAPLAATPPSAAPLAPASAAPYARPAIPPVPLATPGTRAGATAPPPPPLDLSDRVPTPRARRSPALLMGLLALLLALAAAAYYLFGPGRRSRTLDEGVAAYQAGRREAARRSFEAAAAADPSLALPHVYLGRLAREDGDIAKATSELTTALQRDTGSVAALREMGTVQLVAGQPALAVRFFTRALERDGSDRLAAGGMACALMQQGNTAPADRFFARAGSGPWDSCRQTPPAAMMPGLQQTLPAPGTPVGTAPATAPR